MLRNVVCWTISLIFLNVGVAQETKEQADALAVLAKIDGKATFDSTHSKRVIAIDI